MKEPHRHGEAYVVANGDVMAMGSTIEGARFLQRMLAKKGIESEVWQGWRIGGER